MAPGGSFFSRCRYRGASMSPLTTPAGRPGVVRRSAPIGDRPPRLRGGSPSESMTAQTCYAKAPSTSAMPPAMGTPRTWPDLCNTRGADLATDHRSQCESVDAMPRSSCGLADRIMTTSSSPDSGALTWRWTETKRRRYQSKAASQTVAEGKAVGRSDGRCPVVNPANYDGRHG
jgi:hypothetical protein